MHVTKRQYRALKALNLDLFHPETLIPPAPATLHSRIREQAGQRMEAVSVSIEPSRAELPTEAELSHLFDRYNWMFFDGKLPKPEIEYSARMRTAGSYIPSQRIIRIGRKYHEVFPEEIGDTLKHEMIHIRHLNHDRAFKAEAARIGASIQARSHPLLTKPPRYVYICWNCGREYPRQRRLRMASCGYCSSGSQFDPRYKLRLKKDKKKTWPATRIS